jgi:hypothetical protein
MAPRSRNSLIAQAAMHPPAPVTMTTSFRTTISSQFCAVVAAIRLARPGDALRRKESRTTGRPQLRPSPARIAACQAQAGESRRKRRRSDRRQPWRDERRRIGETTREASPPLGPEFQMSPKCDFVTP